MSNPNARPEEHDRAQVANTQNAISIANKLSKLENVAEYRLWRQNIINIIRSTFCRGTKPAQKGNDDWGGFNTTVYDDLFRNHNANPKYTVSTQFATCLLQNTIGPEASTIVNKQDDSKQEENANPFRTALMDLDAHYKTQAENNIHAIRTRIESRTW